MALITALHWFNWQEDALNEWYCPLWFNCSQSLNLTEPLNLLNLKHQYCSAGRSVCCWYVVLNIRIHLTAFLWHVTPSKFPMPLAHIPNSIFSNSSIVYWINYLSEKFFIQTCSILLTCPRKSAVTCWLNTSCLVVWLVTADTFRILRRTSVTDMAWEGQLYTCSIGMFLQDIWRHNKKKYSDEITLNLYMDFKIIIPVSVPTEQHH